MIRIAIFDDHAVVRTGLRQFLSDYVDLTVVAEASSGHDAVDVVRAGGIDVVLMDVSMPGQNGVDALRAIKARAPDLPVLMLSGYPEEQYAVSLMRQGASGYLNKDCDPVDIVSAIRTVARGRKYITRAMAARLLLSAKADGTSPEHEGLSDREFQVFIRLAQGERIGHIADTIALSVKTVSSYRARVLEKLQLTSNSDLTYYAFKKGLIQ